MHMHKPACSCPFPQSLTIASFALLLSMRVLNLAVPILFKQLVDTIVLIAQGESWRDQDLMLREVLCGLYVY
jgi:hypothetical protein